MRMQGKVGLKVAAFSGKRVMVVEDNLFLVMALEEVLLHLGHSLAGSAQSLEQALQLAADASFDCAIVDVDLHGLDSFPLLDLLSERGIPFVLATGLPLSEIPEQYRRGSLVTKPYDAAELDRAIKALCG